MRKVLVVALREYRAAVRTKAFLISLFLMPLLMGGSIGVQLLLHRMDDTKDKHFAVIDRTPDHTLFDELLKAAEKRNQNPPQNTGLSKQLRGAFVLEFIEPSTDDDNAVKQQRLDLSKRVEAGEFRGFLEIGAKVLEYDDPPKAVADKASDDAHSIRYQSNNPTFIEFSIWADKELNAAIEQHRFAEAQVNLDKVRAIQQQHVNLRVKALTRHNDRTGEIDDAPDESQIANILVPGVLIALMFLMIMIGATPAMQSVIEEKMQRIAEVLLGSVTPFQLMLGKLIGMVGVSLTVAAVYLIGAYIVAGHYGYTEYLAPQVLAWFLAYLVLAVLMFGSLFIAVGAAATDMKESQSLLLPIMLVACLPLFVLGAIIQEPNGTLATTMSFIPTATPMLMTARLAVPPGIPWWQPLLGVVGVLASTLGCVWAAGRIFRVGLLMQGKGARFADMIKWVARG
jgi:ABC-2 type transport system permease protein